MGWFDRFREFSPEKRKQLAQEGKALPDGSFPIVTVGDLKNAIAAAGRAKARGPAIRHIKRRAKALGATNQLPEDWAHRNQEADEMADKPEKTDIVPEEKITPETVPSEELTQARTELEKATARASTAEKQLAEIRAKELTASLKAEAESFKALSVPVDEYVQKMTALRVTDAGLAQWVYDQFTATDKALVAAGLLREVGSGQEANLEGPDALVNATEGILKSRFNGDMDKWPEALAVATKEFPKLAAEYAAGG